MSAVHEVLRLQSSVALHWFQTCATVVSAFAAVADPRPDLSVPARSVRAPYAWWW